MVRLSGSEKSYRDADGRRPRAVTPKSAEERRQGAGGAPTTAALGRAAVRVIVIAVVHCKREIGLTANL
jgi:hypothetical protein